MLTEKWLKINSRLQPFQLVYSSEAAFLHCLAYSLLFLLKNGANIEYKSLWCAIPILLIQYPWRAAPLLHYSTQVSLSKRRGFIKYKALASIIVSSLNSSTHSQMPYAISASACVCVSSFIHRHKTGAGVFSTGSTEVHKYLAKPFIIQNLLNTSLCMGNKFAWTDPRCENEHRPPVCSGCDQSVLISYIRLPNNSSSSHAVLHEHWLRTWARCTCASWKVPPAGCPAV